MDVPPPHTQPTKPEGGVGPLAAIIIVVALFALGGIYFLVTTQMSRHASPPSTNEQTSL